MAAGMAAASTVVLVVDMARISKNYENFGNSGDFSDFFQQMFGGGAAGRSRGSAKYRGQDFNAELQLSFQEAAQTHKQMLTVNGKQIRITIPAGVDNGQTIKCRAWRPGQ